MSAPGKLLVLWMLTPDQKPFSLRCNQSDCGVSHLRGAMSIFWMVCEGQWLYYSLVQSECPFLVFCLQFPGVAGRSGRSHRHHVQMVVVSKAVTAEMEQCGLPIKECIQTVQM